VKYYAEWKYAEKHPVEWDLAFHKLHASLCPKEPANHHLSYGTAIKVPRKFE
jgi:hypothetical protein